MWICTQCHWNIYFVVTVWEIKTKENTCLLSKLRSPVLMVKVRVSLKTIMHVCVCPREAWTDVGDLKYLWMFKSSSRCRGVSAFGLPSKMVYLPPRDQCRFWESFLNRLGNFVTEQRSCLPLQHVDRLSSHEEQAVMEEHKLVVYKAVFQHVPQLLSLFKAYFLYLLIYGLSFVCFIYLV